MEAVTTGCEQYRIVIELPPEPPTEEALSYQAVLDLVEETVTQRRNPYNLGKRFAKMVLEHGQVMLTDELIETLGLGTKGQQHFEEGFNMTMITMLGWRGEVRSWRSMAFHGTLFTVELYEAE